jgi:hypothetical protein
MKDTHRGVCGCVVDVQGRKWEWCEGHKNEPAVPATSTSYKEFVNVNGVKLATRLSEVIGRSVHMHTPADERVSWLSMIERLEECLTITKEEGDQLREILFRMAGGQR